MKCSSKVKIASALTVAAMYSACQPAATSAALVSSSLKMTGAAKAATVAQHSPKGILGLLLNQAFAFVSPSIVDSNAVSINLTNAWVVIKEIEFEAAEIKEANEVDGSEVSFKGPYYADLLSNSPLVLDTQSIPAAPYKRIKMKLHSSSATLPSGIPLQLTNNSIFLQGTVGVNNFTLQLDDSTELSIAGANPVVPADGVSLLIEVNLANIFKQINMSTVANNEIIDSSNRHAGTNLCPSIDASANDLYTCIRKGLQTHANFGDDSDGNDDLGSTEDVH